MASETLVFTAPDGNTLDIRSDTTWVRGVDGRFSPPVQIIADAVPNMAGSRFRSARDLDRILNIPWAVTESDRAALRAFLVQSASTMDPTQGLGTLTLTNEAGASYDLECVLQDGFGAGDADGSPNLQRLVLQFRAPDPYWYDASPVATTYELGGEEGSIFPFPPLILSSSTVFSNPTITNNGTIEAWPIWTITGPGSDLILRNNTTDKTLTLPHVLTAGEYLEIDTRRDHKTVTVDGVSVFDELTGALWSLAKGENSVSIELNSATEDTVVALQYYQGYRAA